MADKTMNCDFLEGNPNELVHVFYEFYMFLFLLNHDSKTSQELHNILLESRLLRSRVIMDFFSEKKKRPNNKPCDDITVDDIVKNGQASNYYFDKSKYSDVRRLINKTTAHLTNASCSAAIFPTGLEDKTKFLYVDLAKMILNFVGNINTIIKDDLKTKLQDEDVRKLISDIVVYEFETIIKNLQYFIEENGDSTNSST